MRQKNSGQKNSGLFFERGGCVWQLVVIRLVRMNLLIAGGLKLFKSALVAVTATGTGIALLSGPTDLSQYPVPDVSPYQLPWKAGVDRLCVQGNRGFVSHQGVGRFAWDFAMPVGSDVCAARGGVVVRVVDHHEKRGNEMPNNLVAVDHGDGTVGNYLHLRKGGALVVVGQNVEQGERIAESGNVGRSMMPHLHFHVRKGEGTIPVSFVDVATDKGVPRTGKRYRARE